MALEPLGAAAERGDRTRTLVLFAGCAGDGEAAAILRPAPRVGRGGSTPSSASPGRRMMRLASSSSPGGRRLAGGRRRSCRRGRGVVRRAAGGLARSRAAPGRAADGEAALGFLLRAALGFRFVERGAPLPRACALRRPRALRVRGPSRSSRALASISARAAPPPRAHGRRRARGHAPRALPRSGSAG